MDAEGAGQAFECLAWPAAVFGEDLHSVRLANAAAQRQLGLFPGEFDPHAPAWSALEAIINSSGKARSEPTIWNRLVDGRHEAWLVQANDHDFGLLVVAQDLTPLRLLETQREQQAAQQRELLLREVHHRLKNSLQGVAGLLEHFGAEQPQARPALQKAAAQVLAVAEVYGLSGRTGLPPALSDLAQSLCASLGALFSTPIAFELHHRADAVSARVEATEPATLRNLLCAHLEPSDGSAERGDTVSWRLRPDDAPAIALCLNELLTNALKHGAAGAVGIRCEVSNGPDGVEVLIRNPGTLPDGRDDAKSRQGLSGLGLVRALLPRRGARLQMRTQDGEVCARLHIGPPCAQPEPAAGPQSQARG